MRTTPKPPLDIAQIFPFLSGKEKITVRLHPRQGSEPDINQSKLGGRFLWSKDEPWPTCTKPEVALLSQYDWSSAVDYSLGHGKNNIWQADHPQHNDFYIGLLQLRAGDFPEIEFPSNTNLFQLLWCPRDHIKLYSPTCLVFWRKEEEITDPITKPPSPSFPEQDLIPRPCCLNPERVTEYPNIAELQGEERQKLMEWDEKEECIYQCLLSTAPGIKVGGYPNWFQDSEIPACQCGREMEHLLTIDSSEFDPATAPRWCPIEDQQVWQESEPMISSREAQQAAALAQVAPELIIGDVGSVYLFICRQCEGWPIQSVFQD